MTKLLSAMLVLTTLLRCQPVTHKIVPTQEQVNKDMEAVNRQLAHEESMQIDAYVERRGWHMTQTTTGLRYEVYEKAADSASSPQAIEGMMATVEYSVSLLDGTLIYSSEESGTREFLIGQDNVESGVHEGIQYMRTNERARFILPSHLAHGLSGDFDQIPPRSTLIYDIHLIQLR